MTTYPHKVFKIVDPPTPEHLAIVRRTLDAIEYPWHRLIPMLRSDSDQAVLILWADTGQGTSGTFTGGTYEIRLSTQPYHQDLAEVGFVLAHEVGHLVDRATFFDQEKYKVMEVMHRPPYWDAWGTNHDNQPHTEQWRNSGDEYTERIFEAYADQFVAAFAPKVWDGTAIGGQQRYPRFYHWTDEHTEIHRITLERRIVAFTDVPANHPHREGIEWAAGEGLVTGYADGTFKPENTVNRGQLCTILHRQAQQEG